MKMRKTIFDRNFKCRIVNFRLSYVSSCFFIIKIFFVLASLIVRAQDEAPPPIIAQNFHQWGAVTLFSGLPSDNVRAIAQTSDGVLWFGTDNGLARFDGRRVQTVAFDINADSNKILALETAADGTLWIGTERGAYISREDKFQKIEETRDSSITSILFGENVYLSTAGSGVIFKVRETPDRSFSVERIPDRQIFGTEGQPLKITSLAQTGDKIVVGTHGRSILIVENNQSFESFSRPRPFFINVLAQDTKGNLWLGANAKDGDSGFFSLNDITRPEKIGEGLGEVSAIEPDTTTNSVWTGTQKNGLFHFRGTEQLEHFTFENTAGGLRSNTINALFIDREGVLWVGTNRGVSRFDASSPFNQTLSKESANGNFVRTFYQARNGQLLAGTNQGLFLYPSTGGAWLEAEHFSAKAIYAIAEDMSKQILIGTSSGLFDFDGKQKMAGDVRAIAHFQNKNYAAVFGRGVLQIENQAQIFSNNTTSALFADGDDKLWIGTTKGEVFAFDGKETKPENALESLRGAALRKIAKGGENDLWLSGERGLFRYKNGELQTVIPNRDVRDFFITGAAEIWAATLNGGLIHLKYDKDFGWLSVDLNVEQGLPSEQIFALLQQENRLLIGTNRGVVSYVPGTVAPKITVARVLSQRLYTAEEIEQTIKLEYPRNSILVEVAGLSSRTFPEEFQYAFFLKNSKGDVLDKRLSSDPQFAPANLRAGDYQIEARTFNRDLLTSEPLVIRFSVARSPFPWTAAALGVLLAIAVIALIWAGIERKRISAANRDLRAARFDLANEAERERKRIARDLHDQTLADLRALMLMSDKLPTDNTAFRSEIESVSIEIRRICEDLSPSVLENVGLIASLEFLLTHTIENHKFSAAENLEESLSFSPNAQMQIYRIAQEVLNNIKRHSNARLVEMNVDISEDEQFILLISDDGTAAFSPGEIGSKGRGISNIKSRAALIEAGISWQASENGNTIFRLRKQCRNKPA